MFTDVYNLFIESHSKADFKTKLLLTVDLKRVKEILLEFEGWPS